MTPDSTATTLPERLSADLLLRRANPRDREALSQMQATVQAGPDGTANMAAATWAEDLLSGTHPTTDASNISVVEDLSTNQIVSSLSLVRQTWAYAGIPFGVGRIELVATRPEYRRRGLTNRQLALLHEWSESRGDLVQAITDLMFFHGELGYQMAMTQRAGRGGEVKKLSAPSKAELVTLRHATVDDIPALAVVDEYARRRTLVSCLRDARQWEYELSGRSKDNMMRDEVFVVLSDDAPVGYVVLGYGGIPTFPIPEWLPGEPFPERVVSVVGMELLPEVSWVAAVPSVLRQLVDGLRLDHYMLWLGTEHPAYSVLDDLLDRNPPAVGWFVRIPDLVKFITKIAPVVAQRLRGSAAERFTGTLRLHLYTHGLVLHLDDGRLTGVEPWEDANRRSSDVSLPEQMLTQLLLGHAAFDEVAAAFPDARIQTRTGRLLLPIIFPRRTSHIWPVA